MFLLLLWLSTNYGTYLFGGVNPSLRSCSNGTIILKITWNMENMSIPPCCESSQTEEHKYIKHSQSIYKRHNINLKCNWYKHVQTNKAMSLVQSGFKDERETCTYTQYQWHFRNLNLRYRFHINKAYFLGLCKGILPQNMALYGTVPPI